MKAVSPNRMLITGGAGFIGSAVVRQAIHSTGHQVLVVDKLTYAGNLENLASVIDNPRLTFVRADITDAGRMRELIRGFRPHVLMHLAAESHVDRSIDSARPFIDTNVVGTFILLEAALEYWRTLVGAERDQFRFHHVSTDEVFGSIGPQGAFTESSPYLPNSPYSATKAASDHLVRAWSHTFGLPMVLSNCTNNYGPYQFPEKLIPLTILNALEGKSLPIYGKGEHVRDWLYVDDHASALFLVAEKGRIGEAYNVGGNTQWTNLQVVQEICKVMDELAPDDAIGPRECLISFVTDRPGHDLRYAMDCAKIRDELGWKPRETFASGLRKTIHWFLTNRQWWAPIREQRYRGERLGMLA